MAKQRLDIQMVERGLCASRALAQKLIMAGTVRVNGEFRYKPGELIGLDAGICVEAGPRFVSRGGEKLQAGLTAFNLIVSGAVCADVGASTGGFTDCLLQAGAVKVYAIDVGYGQIALKIRNDQRVVLMERTNARFIESLPEPIQIAAIDASFISLKVLLPVVKNWLTETKGSIVALIKPQFEAGQKAAGRGKGVILDENIHQEVVDNILDFSSSIGLAPVGLIQSPLTGPKGNREFLIHLVNQPAKKVDVQKLMAGCFPGRLQVNQ
ncbi:MAG: TlyA family RNA methyltransferase [Anaerolineaceae bacterium]|nr:TlyA family RNA methyltransferase [Anaerolineaceae bacterium]